MLIYDRSQEDVDRWKELHDKGWAAMNDVERSEWLGFMKGRYTSEDMNRVETAVKSLSARLFELGYLTRPQITKTDWGAKSYPLRKDMERYFGNVAEIRAAIPLFPTTPHAPTVNGGLDFKKANDLEKILFDVDQITTVIPKAYHYAGEIFCGEV